METELVRMITAKVLGLDLRSVKRSSNLTQELGADSMDLLKIMIELEERTQIMIDKNRFSKAGTVSEIAGLLANS